MRIIKINPKNPSLKAIKVAARVISNGGVIIYPTDTIYGIGANALSRQAIDKIYKIKERSRKKPFSVIASDIKMAKKYCTIGAAQEKIFKTVFPGPFTLIFKVKSTKGKTEFLSCYDSLEQHKKRNNHKNIFTVYKKTLSVRVPNSKITSLLIKELKIPFTATSANISGLPGSGNIRKVLRQLGLNNKKSNLLAGRQVDLVLDAGILPKKDPSIIIDLTGKKPKTIRK